MIYIQTLLILASLLAGGTIANSIEYRLPDSTFPSHYTLRIAMNTELGSSNNYTGQVQIDISVRYPTDLIVLHSDTNLKIHQVHLNSLTSVEPIGIQSTDREADTQFLKINTDRKLNQSEQYQLTIHFDGYFVHGFDGGFTLGKSHNAGKDEFYAVTVFEPIHARKAFPCYDEPMLKATFDVEIECGKDYSARSNAEMKEVQMVGEDRKLVRFERTPPMASYLVAFLISKFDEEVRDFEGLKIGMITQPDDGRSGDLELALQATWFFVDSLQNYTAQKYPFPKLDQVGLDSYRGGLENWGLILYQTDTLFVDPQEDWDKVDSVMIIAHEVAHQFFGNLVGVTWWEHLWLKEGFATLMQYKLTSQFLPDARQLVNQQFVFGTWMALDFDASPLTFPMSKYVEDPNAISAHYERSIAYDKAACVIRMMEVALGEAAFKAGVQTYIANDLFGTADPYKLYLSLQKSSKGARLPAKVHVGEILHTWVAQSGHPIVHVERIGESNSYRLTQRNYGTCAAGCNGSLWWIPIFYSSYDLGERFAGWFPDTTDTITLVMDGDLPLVNSHGHGFYRVSYSQNIRNDILNKWSSIESADRAKLIDDAFGILREGREEKSFGFLKSMLNLLKTESDPLPWMAAMADHNLGKVMRLPKGRSNVGQMVQSLTLQMLEKFRNDSRIENKKAREFALKWEDRLGLTLTTSARTVRQSKHMSGLCPQLVSPEKIEELRCNARLLDEMLQSVDIEMCFSGPDEFLQFLTEVVFDFECPDGLNVVLVLLKRGIPDEFVDKLLHWLNERSETLQNRISRDRLEEFLKGVTAFIFETDHKQLFRQMLDRLGVTNELRITVHKLLDVHQSRINSIAQMLLEF